MLAVDFHQFQAQIAALGLLLDAVLQQRGGLVQATGIDVRLSLTQHVVGTLGSRRHQWCGDRRGHHHRSNHRRWRGSRRRGSRQLHARRRNFQAFEAAFRQVEIGRERLIFGQGTGHAQMFLGCLLGFASTRQQQQQEQENHRTATDQAQQQRIGQQFIELLIVRCRRCRLDGLLGWRGRCLRGRRSGNRCRRCLRVGSQLGRHCRRGRSRWSSRSALGLQLGQLVVLQLDQALQLVYLALQIGHAAFQFGVITTTGVEAFLGHRQLVAEGLGISGSPFARVLAGLGRHQAQLVGGRLRRSTLGTSAIGGVELLLPCPGFCHIAATLAPGLVLCGHFGNGLGLRQASALRLVRHAQHLAGFQAVDVAVDKGIRVQRLDGQHGLLDRTAITRLCGDFPQGIARRGGVLGRFGRTGDGRGNR
ncbi:hypothetical protein D3C78_954080 [compost metagenome]